MGLKYAEWSYENLLSIQKQLKELHPDSHEDPDAYYKLQHELQAVADELASRIFILVGTISGRMTREYGRWNNEAKCQEQAVVMGLPLGQELSFGGEIFKMNVYGVPND